jgi:antibiotic biosynthesis monooxygenase (ABM) superfamily enzyme
MAITHVVLLQLKPETTEEQVLAALEHVQELQQKIPGIISVHVGKNLNTTHNQGYTYGFVMQFETLGHLRAYAPHPDHRVVGSELESMSQSIIDYDIGE